MNDFSPLRIKCAMIVYELEKSLGRFCRENCSSLESSKAAKDIATRIVSSDDRPNVSTLIEHSYLAEVIALSIHAAKGTSYSDWMISLEKLCIALSVFDIRNAISHPNRPFPEHFWYRCMAIASDPSISALGLFEVELALQNSIAGKIEEPPAEWIQKARWSIPTVLPDYFEHAITGLFGRAKESAKLEKELTNPRSPLIAVVARGGVGKTSLTLQVVSDFCLSEKSISLFDFCLWITLKQEKLTEHGIEILSAPKSMEDLENSICEGLSAFCGEEFGSIAESTEYFYEKRVLLCIDNLETILRDESSRFSDLYESLPPKWKVLITSRIPVDGAKNIPLDVLSDQGASALARAYFSSKGSPEQDADFLKKISSSCKFNPLAIRLTIDLYLSGHEITEALTKSDQEVLEFSFTNLIETLDNSDKNILEALFVFESSTRVQLCEALGIDVDSAAKSIAKLHSISLVSRHEAEGLEAYSLGSSIRDLLRTSPCNLSTRSSVASWLQTARSSEEQIQRLQLERRIPKVALEYVPEKSTYNEIQLSKQIAKAKKGNRPLLCSIESQIRHKLAQNSESSFTCRLYAWCLLELDDPSSAYTYFQRSQALDESDPSSIYGECLALHAQGKLKEIYQPSKKLLELGYGEIQHSGFFIANRIWSFYLLAANIMENLSEVLTATEDWENLIDDYPSKAISRASAYRRLADMEHRQGRCDEKRLGELLAKATKPIRAALIAHNCQKWMLPELSKIVGEIEYYATRNVSFISFREDDAQILKDFSRFCNEMSDRFIAAGISQESIRKVNNFCQNTQWSEECDMQSDQPIERDGMVIAYIKKGGKPGASFVFAQDTKNVDYYIKLDIFENGSWKNRYRLVPGAKVALRYEQSPGKNALTATEAWLQE